MACEFGVTFYLILKMSMITSQSESLKSLKQMACEFGVTFYLILKMSMITSQSESHIINFSRQTHEGVNGIL